MLVGGLLVEGYLLFTERQLVVQSIGLSLILLVLFNNPLYLTLQLLILSLHLLFVSYQLLTLSNQLLPLCPQLLTLLLPSRQHPIQPGQLLAKHTQPLIHFPPLLTHLPPLPLQLPEHLLHLPLQLTVLLQQLIVLVFLLLQLSCMLLLLQQSSRQLEGFSLVGLSHTLHLTDTLLLEHVLAGLES